METSTENAESLIDDVTITKADCVKMPMERNLVLAHLEKRACALKALVNAMVERKIALTNDMA